MKKLYLCILATLLIGCPNSLEPTGEQAQQLILNIEIKPTILSSLPAPNFENLGWNSIINYYRDNGIEVGTVHQNSSIERRIAEALLEYESDGKIYETHIFINGDEWIAYNFVANNFQWPLVTMDPL